MTERLKDIMNVLDSFATKPSAIIYIGSVVILAISEWQNPTNFRGLIYKVILLILVFIVITVFNSQYFKWWKKGV